MKRSNISLRTPGKRKRTRTPHARACKSKKAIANARNTCPSSSSSSSKVSDKLEALKNLINASHKGEVVKADDLFRETAKYIVLLKTQVFVLQRLIQFYGSTTTEKDNDKTTTAAPAAAL